MYVIAANISKVGSYSVKKMYVGDCKVQFRQSRSLCRRSVFTKPEYMKIISSKSLQPFVDGVAQ